jgi:hypothetical protein
MLVKIALGVGIPLLAALVWGTFLSPRATVQLAAPWRLLLELLVFGLAIASLAAASQPKLAWAFGLVYVINRVLLFLLEQSLDKREGVKPY